MTTLGASIRFGLCLVSTLILSAPVLADGGIADGPAAIAPASQRARQSFKSFADSWMQRLHQQAERERKNPALRAPSSPNTYHAYSKDFNIELRPTGHPTAPYVGLIRYGEHTYTCSNGNADGCRMSATKPITEIFRYQDGRWIY